MRLTGCAVRFGGERLALIRFGGVVVGDRFGDVFDRLGGFFDRGHDGGCRVRLRRRDYLERGDATGDAVDVSVVLTETCQCVTEVTGIIVDYFHDVSGGFVGGRR